MSFDYTLDFNSVDFKQHPELYRIGKGEQGVLLVQPYKSERYCLTGGSKHLKLLTAQQTKFTRCSLTTKRKKILLGWIWLVSSCRWATPDREGMPITNQAESTPKAPRKYCHAKKIQSRHNQPRSFMRNGKWQEKIRST